MQEKEEEEGGYDAIPLLCFETKHKGTCCPPYFYHFEVKTNKQKHEIICKKKGKKKPKKSLLP
jgi:hypothetical protein